MTQIAFDNSYARLAGPVLRPRPADGRDRTAADRAEPAAGASNSASIRTHLSTPEGVEILAGKRIPEGAEPIATAYAGHQFGNFVPQLGDGRAILLGEVVDRDGLRQDIQLKGSGPDAVLAGRRRAGGAWARCCANIWSARPWRRSAFPRRARSRPC